MYFSPIATRQTNFQAQKKRSATHFSGNIQQNMGDITKSNCAIDGSVSASMGKINLDNVTGLVNVNSNMGTVRVNNTNIGGSVQSSMGKVTLSSSTVAGNITAEMGGALLVATSVEGRVSTGTGGATIKEANKIGSVTSSTGKIEIEKATVTDGVESSIGAINITDSSVAGGVQSGGSITSHNSDINKIVKSSNGKINITADAAHPRRISGRVSGGTGHVTLENVNVTGDVKASNGKVKISSTGAEPVIINDGVITSTGEIELNNVISKGDIETSVGAISLGRTTIYGDVILSSDKLRTNKAVIEGQLTLTSNDTRLSDVAVKDIQVNAENGISISVTSEGSTISISDSTIRNSSFNVKGRNGGRSNVRVGNITSGGDTIISGSSVSAQNVTSGGDININGDRIQLGKGFTLMMSGDDESRLTIKHGLLGRKETVYVNGRKISGEGPDTYAEYRLQNSNAPVIQAPGWSDEGAASVDDGQPKKPSQILELGQGAVVTGTVTFESGNGKLIVGAGAQFTGEVVGGTVERQ